jgi:choline dehydrogenase-like flavoprotein
MDHVDRSMPSLGLLIAAVMHVHSRGSLQMHTDPTRSPLAEFDMLSDERDADALRVAIRTAQRCLDDPSFTAVADVLPYDASDHGLRVSLGDYVHAAGTCRMGGVDDPLAVVDVFGRVIGYECLSVVDASVMPALPRANTHLPTVMIAERLAARMRSTWSRR